MAAKSSTSKGRKKVGSLSAKPVSGKQARGVRGGITVTKRMDSASALLFQHCANGKHYAK